MVANTLDATLTLDRDWPIGMYEADVLINDKPFTEIIYKVEGGETFVTTPQGLPGVGSVVLLRDDGNGNPGGEVKGFACTDCKIHFEVRLTL